MKKIVFIIILLSISLVVFCQSNSYRELTDENLTSITEKNKLFDRNEAEYLEINNIDQLFDWLEKNNLDSFKECFLTGFIPFCITDEGGQVILQKGMNIEGKNLKSTYEKDKYLVDLYDKDNSKYLTDREVILNKTDCVIAKYNVIGDYKDKCNIDPKYGKFIQIITIEKDNKIVWYNKNFGEKGFNLLDCIITDDNKIMIYYTVASMFTPWKPELYLDVINAKNISYIERFKFPITLSSNALGDKRTISGNIISGNMVKLNMDYYYDIYEKEIPISIIWVYNYPMDKEKLYKSNPITKLRYFELSPKALWVNEKESYSSFYKFMMNEAFYYDLILQEAEPSTEELKSIFPEDTFFKE